eukprot:ANDGO_04271.mRNA.1 Mediator of RNA polymerase II transcription subunit 6
MNVTYVQQQRDRDMRSFMSSSFYDRTSLNQIALMRNMPLEALDVVDGLRYRVAQCEPPRLTIINAEMRYKQDVSTVAVYYVLDGVVFEGKELYSWLQMRLRNATAHMANAFEEYRAWMLRETGSQPE